MRWPWRLRRAIEPRPMVSRAMELETAKEILEEVFHARPGDLEDSIQAREIFKMARLMSQMRIRSYPNLYLSYTQLKIYETNSLYTTKIRSKDTSKGSIKGNSWNILPWSYSKW